MSASSLTASSRRELDELRQQLRQQLDSRTIKFVPRDDDQLEDLRVYMPRTVEQHESKFDTDEFDTRDWIDGFCPDDDFRLTELEKRDAEDVVSWLHRDESDAEIHYRWIMTPEQRIQSDDSLTESEKAALLDELQAGREQWTARQTQFRRAQLHRLCIEWFRTNDYSSHDVVVSWKRQGDRWMPDERINVLAWIRSKVAERGELAGYASCAATLRNRIARRRNHS